MALAIFRHRVANSTNKVAGVDTFTITAASTSNTAVWTLTRTLQDGSTVTVTYTEDGSPTVAEIATGLYDAIVASTSPYFQEITAANPSDGVFTCTGPSGEPLNLALADDDDGTHTETTTTADQSPQNYGQASNWSTDAVPTTSDDVAIPSGVTEIISGLDQSSVAIDEFVVEDGFRGVLGRLEYGQLRYLQIQPNSFEVNGQGSLVALDFGSENISGLIRSTAPGRSDGLRPVMILGTNLATVEVLSGKVGLGILEQEAVTIATLLIGYLQSKRSDSDILIGPDTNITTLTMQGGVCLSRSANAITTATIGKDSQLMTENTGAITTVTNRGTFYPNSSGTITTINGHGLTDFSRDKTARTVTTYNEKPGGHLIIHSGVTITNYNELSEPGEHKITYVE